MNSDHQIIINKYWDGSSIEYEYFISLHISSSTGDIVVKIDAPFHNDPKPPYEVGKVLNLYDFEVVELFFASNISNGDIRESPYLEFEIGPYGHYLLFSFLREADWENVDSTISLESLPKTVINREINRWSSEINIPFYLLPEPSCGDDFSVTWNFNAFAIFGEGDNRKYLALHPVHGDYPNFHQLAYFQPISLSENLSTSNEGNEQTDWNSKSLTPSSSNKIVKETVFNRLDQLKEEVDEDRESTVPSFAHLNITADNSPQITKPLTDSTAPRNDAVMHSNFAVSTVESEKIKTIDDIARQLKDSIDKLLKQRQISIDLEEKYSRHIQTDEFVVLHEYLWKRKGFSYKKRKLILTSKPRLIYFDGNGVYKGFIQWSLTKRLLLEKVERI